MTYSSDLLSLKVLIGLELVSCFNQTLCLSLVVSHVTLQLLSSASSTKDNPLLYNVSDSPLVS